jgi:hypothetical protein
VENYSGWYYYEVRRRLTDWHVLDRHPSRDVDGGVKGTRGCFWLVIKYV